MRIVVFGGCGFIGTNVCLEARNRGHEVIAFDNLSRNLTEENIPVLLKAGVIIIRGDVRNVVDFEKLPWIPEGIVQLSAQCGIPYAQLSPKYDFEINCLGAINVLEYSRTHGKFPIIFASTNKIYSDLSNTLPMNERETRYELSEDAFDDVAVSGLGFSEDFPLDAFGRYGRSLYGTSKAASDLYHQEYYQAFQVPVAVNRMSCIFGLYQKGTEDQAWVDHFLRTIAFGDGKINISGTGKQVRDVLFGSDCARLYLDELENVGKVQGKAYNIGGGIKQTLSLLGTIKYIEKITEKRASLTFLPKRYADQDIWISDLTKIKNDLGWEPTVSAFEGIDRMFKKYREERV